MNDSPEMSANTGSRLFIVGTPIGNLGDITIRAIETLRAVDIIACEDTRRTRKLLSHYGIRKKLVSLHSHSKASRVRDVIGLVEAGASVAYVTDAGMPTLSDPGHMLVVAAFEKQLTVEVIPGPSALTAVLAYTQFESARFTFEGFLPRKGKERASRIAAIAARESPSVIFEAPGRIGKLLDDLEDACGKERRVLVARELTKAFETVECFRLADRESANLPEKGEYSIVVEGAADDNVRKDARVKQISQAVVQLRQDGVSNRDILRVLKAIEPEIASSVRGMVLDDDVREK
ncbi:16S rRNA (cytidine(1402)-2'-O)-methyltransferase [bacterium]|nr:16S rRNA (cytidine(1402)-2'-O)-methyltransferase [bacterium]